MYQKSITGELIWHFECHTKEIIVELEDVIISIKRFFNTHQLKHQFKVFYYEELTHSKYCFYSHQSDNAFESVKQLFEYVIARMGHTGVAHSMT
ncbi:hypothetical protein KCM76_20750 [Zooshikella marina]|uniref:hypothetical protein n=1 Tax=Zooshikella ganghwensis TaxID=202772 RepID=UPI001BAF34C0|nr:hypothetical protein [Zooshikella ganghwensis]MBU2708435.1 hypothetical protein [Zooshikella ganghwensis]